MRITTWNINGLRAALGKGFEERVRALNADVLCLQEIKSRADQLDAAQHASLTGLYPYITWNPASRPGYSGTATFSRSQAVQEYLGMGLPEFDGEGRLIASRFPGPLQDVLLFNIYFPNGSRDLSRVPYKLDFYARLLEWCDGLHSEGLKIILTGDFNTSHTEKDIKNARANAGSTGFLPEERAWIDRYLEHGFVDAFRNLYPDKIEYTWWSYIGNARGNNTGWRLDYFLVSEALMDRVTAVTNHTEVMGSDHCPVSLDLRD
ncbi:MAG: exodeoxyribonuclease III [Anaerolineae bacterium]|nr:exodeoxyribonuclease III [Anaerolineae bacterium]